MKPLGRVLGLVYGLGVLAAAIVAALISGMLIAVPFIPLRRGKRERFSVWCAVVWSHVVVRGFLLARPTVTGRGTLPSDRGALVVGNHRSWIDPLLMAGYLRAMGLSKKEIFYLPFIGLFAYLAGAVFVDRKSPERRKRARQEVMDLVRSGARVALFPEGTRTRDGELKDKVYLTLVRDCWEAEVLVLPVGFWGTERTLPATQAMAVPFQSCRMDIGAVMDPRGYESADAFAEAVWEDVRQRVARLRAEDEAAE